MHLSRALNIYIGMRLCFSLIFAVIVTINLVYQASVVGLNPLQLVLVGTLLETVSFLFEVPTGIVADLYSRKASVIVGHFLMGCGFIIEGSIATFSAVLVAQVIWGVGYTFISGAREAWIADEIGEENAGRAFINGQQTGQIGTFIGILISMALANINIRLPIILGGLMFCVLSLFLTFLMPEEHFSAAPVKWRDTLLAMKYTILNGFELINKRRVLIFILLTGMIFGTFSEGFDRLWTPFMLNNFTFPTIWSLKPVVWFGIISMVATTLAILVSEMFKKGTNTLDHESTVKSLFLINTMLILGVVTFGLTGSFSVAVGVYWFVTMFRESRVPLFDAWTNQNLESQVRATVFSMCNQANALGQILGGPIVGFIANVFSIRISLIVAGLALIPSLFLYGHSLKKSKFSFFS